MKREHPSLKTSNIQRQKYKRVQIGGVVIIQNITEKCHTIASLQWMDEKHMPYAD